MRMPSERNLVHVRTLGRRFLGPFDDRKTDDIDYIFSGRLDVSNLIFASAKKLGFVR